MSTFRMYVCQTVLHSSVYLRLACLVILRFYHRILKDNLQIIKGLLLHYCLCQIFSTSFLQTFLISSILLNSSLLQRIVGNLEMGCEHVEIHRYIPLHHIRNATPISVFMLFYNPSSTLQQHHEKRYPIFCVSTTTSTTTYHSTISVGTVLIRI